MARWRHAILADLASLAACPPLRRLLLGYGVTILVLLAVASTLLPTVLIASVLIGCLALFPATEFLLHRFALHRMTPYLGHRWLARMWIRIHYAHHRVPERADVILANPLTLLPLIAAANGPMVLLFGPAILPAGIAGVLLPFAFLYEPVHFACHARIRLRSRYLRRRRQRHALHHYHSEQHNFGICASLFDHLCGTHADRVRAVPRSTSARTLGYDGNVARSRPIVRLEYERCLTRR